jgi:hypothetical protein
MSPAPRTISHIDDHELESAACGGLRANLPGWW